jgi:hypothetical protein
MARRLIIGTVSTAVLTFTAPVFAQEPSQGTASIPDFSGIWGHFAVPDFEPPLSGPGPVRNLSRMTIEVVRTFGAVGAANVGASPNGVSSIFEFVGDFNNPILKPEAAEVVKQRGELEKKKIPQPTPANQCWPGGVPWVFWNIGMQMLQQKDKVTILYTDDYDVRHVYMNRTHPQHVTPSWYGDSVGHYEGDTLVIDTVGIKVGPFAMVDAFGTPHTEELHVVERYRLLDYESAKESEDRGERENFRIQFSDTGLVRNPDYKGPGLLLEFTVEDPGVFTTPGQPGLLICARWAVGRNSSALIARATMSAERSTFRMPTN